MFEDALHFVLAQATPAAEESSALIDWWTVGFQILNFLVLVILLRVFLYKRILRAIDQREGKIASHFEAAEEKEQEAMAKAEALERDKREFQEKRESLLREAQAEAEKRRRELSEKAREEVEAQGRRWREDLKREKESFLQLMQGRVTEQVCTVARRALEDLADAELERRMADVLVRRLAELPGEDRTEMTDALKESAKPLVVATAWELPEEDRQKVTAAVREHLTDESDVEFETAPELACGIELRAGGREISWTIAGYVESVREELAGVIDEKLEAEKQRLEAEAAKEKAAREKAAKEKNEAEEKAAKEKRQTGESQEGDKPDEGAEASKQGDKPG